VLPVHRLITIPISHYCEKARWALDRAGIPFVEEPHVQGIHRIAVRRAGGRQTAPVLVSPEGVFSESAEIVAYADARTPAAQRLGLDQAEVRDLQRTFDEHLGPAGRLWMYWNLHGRRDIAAKYNCAGVPRWQRVAFPVGYPVVIRIIDRYLGVSAEASREAEGVVQATFDDVAQRLSDGRPYLTGDRFTAADLTFASLAAAVLMPERYSVPLPDPDELPTAMADRVRRWRLHPAGQHALRMFEEQRRPVMVTSSTTPPS
jgi:glutathione S-transferase